MTFILWETKWLYLRGVVFGAGRGNRYLDILCNMLYLLKIIEMNALGRKVLDFLNLEKFLCLLLHVVCLNLC